VNDLERIRMALEHIVDAPTKVVSRVEWDAVLRDRGKPTRLSEPLGPYLGIQGSPGFEYAVASGAPHAEKAGTHNLRKDEQDPPEGRFNLYSHVIIEDLVDDLRWPEVLRVAGLEGAEDLLALVRAHVFGYARNRDDRWSAEIPEDIAGAEPKN